MTASFSRFEWQKPVSFSAQPISISISDKLGISISNAIGTSNTIACLTGPQQGAMQPTSRTCMAHKNGKCTRCNDPATLNIWLGKQGTSASATLEQVMSTHGQHTSISRTGYRGITLALPCITLASPWHYPALPCHYHGISVQLCYIPEKRVLRCHPYFTDIRSNFAAPGGLSTCRASHSFPRAVFPPHPLRHGH